MTVSREASSKFHGRMFQNDRFVRGFFQISQNKICILPQFRAIDPPNPTRGFIQQNQNVRLATTACHPKFQNVRFAIEAGAKMYESSARRPRQPAAYKNHHSTTVLVVRPARSDERVAPSTEQFAFHHSFGHPMRTQRICISPQFWASDKHEVRRWLRQLKNLHFTTVLGVRRARSHEATRREKFAGKIRISPQFWASDEHEVTRGLLPQREKFACHHSFGRPTSAK